MSCTIRPEKEEDEIFDNISRRFQSDWLVLKDEADVICNIHVSS